MRKARTVKFLNVLAGAAALALSVATAEAKTTLRVVVGCYSDATQGVFEGMAKDFMAAASGRRRQDRDHLVGTLQQRLTTDIAGGTASDIAIIGTRWLVDYVKNDVAEPLNLYDARIQSGFHR